MTSKPKFNKRYSENWPKVSRYCKELTGGKCVLCDRAAKETHHVRYRDGRGAIAGREKPGRDIFPLCEYHHSDLAPDCAHHPDNWKRDFKNFLNNENSYKFQRKLKDAWQEKIKSQTPKLLIVKNSPVLTTRELKEENTLFVGS